jgi:glycosyltransferase involved in cell wall biosynthesis
MKLLATCSSRHPGVKKHMLELRKLLPERVRFIPLEDLVTLHPDCRNSRIRIPGIKRILQRISSMSISRELMEFKGPIVLGGWQSFYPVLIRRLRKNGNPVSILWCSTIGQTEMAWKIELSPFNMILELLQQRKIKYLLVPEKTFESLSTIKNVVYLPHPINPLKINNIPECELEGINVDLFVKARPGKNVLQQMLASKWARSKYTLHTNTTDDVILDIARHLGVCFKHHDWLKENEYYGLIRNMNASLQVTWTESFNYAVAERIMMGVPTLVSSEIFWIHGNEFLRKYIVVEKPDSCKLIAKKLDYLLENDSLATEIREHQRVALKKISEKYDAEIREKINVLLNSA